VQNTGFFGFMWRFNAVAIAAAAVAVVVGALLIGINMAWWFFRPLVPTTDTNLVSGVGEEAQPASYRLSFSRAIPGTRFLVFHLTRTNGERVFSIKGSYEEQEVVNILLVDGATAKGKWLFDGVNRRVGVIDPQGRAPRILPNGMPEQLPAPTALWLVSRPGLSAKVTEQAPTTLLVYSFRDDKLHAIATGIGDINAVQDVGDDTVLVVYEIGTKAMAMTVSKQTLSVTATNELPRLEVDRPQETKAQ
jgi:hypothetical protein